VFCSVTAFGKTITAHLPVMNHKNQAIANPDAFAVNTAMQRCLAKGIALHGLGLYIYSSEDEPLDSESLDIEQLIETVKSSSTREEATKAYQAAMEKCVKAKDTAAAAKLKTAMKGWEPAKVAA
jgi:hypothetical protein